MRSRAIKLKSNHLRCLVGEGGGVGTNIGVDGAGGDWAGAKEPLPGMLLESGAGVLFAVECVGVKAPELLPIDTGGVLCPPLDAGAYNGPDGGIQAGGGVEVFTIGSPGEEDVAPDERLEGLGVMYVAIDSASTG